MAVDLASLAAVVVLGAVHVLVGRLGLNVGPPRSVWLSLAGGASAAYVALHLLPELEKSGDSLRVLAAAFPGAVKHPAYVAALAGIVLFHGLDRLAAASAAARGEAGHGGGTRMAVFTLHVGFFSLYNALLGHLIAQGAPDNLVAYAGALALHFTVNDAELREHHGELYVRYGRWVLAAAVMAGWTLGNTALVPAPVIHACVAVLAGGVLLNIFKDELPPNRKARYWAFLLGIGVYAILRIIGAAA